MSRREDLLTFVRGMEIGIRATLFPGARMVVVLVVDNEIPVIASSVGPTETNGILLDALTSGRPSS